MNPASPTSLPAAGSRSHGNSTLPVIYKGHQVNCGFRVDLLIADAVVVELKAVDKVLPIHAVQLLTYMKLSRKRVGLLINFNVTSLRDGMTRRVL